MKCIQVEDISAYLDNELGEKQRLSVEAHLQDCPHCAGKLQELRSVQTAFGGKERYQAPYGFSTRVLARAAELDRKKTPPFVHVLVRFAEAAVLLAVITIGIATGKAMTNGASHSRTEESSFSLELFEPVPPGSLGGAYIAMTEAGNEK